MADKEAGIREVDTAKLEKTPSGGPVSGSGDPDDLGVNEKHLVRKLDMHLIPLVMLLYLFSFLDR